MKLNRETRDTLFLCAVVALTIAPHLPRLPGWASAAALLLLVWRAALAWRGLALPSRWWLALLLVAACAAAKLSHGLLVGRAAGLTLVCLLLPLKPLEMHSRRDAFVVFFLGFFLVLTQYLHSQALWVALWTLATVWGLLTSLVLAQMPLGQPHLRLAAREAARTTLYGLPAMLLLFMLFPRVAPLWGVPSASGSTGLSERMGIGDVATLAQDERIALRLRALPGSRLPPSERAYFRGPVLTRFDGQEWLAQPESWRLRDALVGDARAQSLDYELVAEPQRLPLLPLLEHSPLPADERLQVQGLSLRRNAELVWTAPRAITERLSLRASARVDGLRLGPMRAHPSLSAALQLPPGLNPRLLAWARELSRGRDAPALVDALYAHIRRERFAYTLSPGVYGESSPHALDEFWFDRRLGFCEHYAAAFVVALRAAGVPARVVTGYQGLDPEPIDGWTVVRNSNAHAWAEYWVEGLGWQRADPTAAVAPERVQRGQRLLAPPGALQGALDGLDPTLWRRLRQFGEALDLRWQQWVLGYAREQQFDLLRRLGFADPDWTALGHAVAACIALLGAAALGWTRWRQRERNPWVRLFARTRAVLRQRGLALAEHQGPLAWAAAAERQGGAAAAELRAALLALEAARYGPAAAQQGRSERRRLWARLRRALQGLDRGLDRGLG